MGDSTSKEATARLVQLAGEIDHLESSRLEMLKRVESIRHDLQNGGLRMAKLRGSVELLREHLANTVAAAAELRAIEEEVRQTGMSVVRMDSDSLGLLFEADSLRESLSEAEDEMERLLSILIEGKTKLPRGH
jgi:chromosome segregation ATPase